MPNSTQKDGLKGRIKEILSKLGLEGTSKFNTKLADPIYRAFVSKEVKKVSPYYKDNATSEEAIDISKISFRLLQNTRVQTHSNPVANEGGKA